MPAAPDRPRNQSAALDLVCIQAAGCDLAIAYMGNTGLRDAADRPLLGVVPSLLKLHQRARREFPPVPEADDLLALMDIQVKRTLAASMQVRDPLPCTARWHAS